MLIVFYLAIDRLTDLKAGWDRLTLDDTLDPLELAITIDDLPMPIDDALLLQSMHPQMRRLEIARNIIEALRSSDVPAVYGFSNGDHPLTWDRSGIEILKLWIESGNFLGNHTFSHKNLSTTTAEAYIADIERMDLLLRSLWPITPSLKLFRYPFLSEGENLEKRNAVRSYLAQKGYTVAGVTVDYLDWAWTGAHARCTADRDGGTLQWLQESVVLAARRQVRRSQKIAKRVMGRDVKHILLLHFSGFNALTLPNVLAALKADGVKFVDLETAMSDTVYTINPNVLTRGGRTFLLTLRLVRRAVAEQRVTYVLVNNGLEGSASLIIRALADPFL
jgi:peptidoglycan/xylan/chitin deacetylase (PgdA/CDA1 family)